MAVPLEHEPIKTSIERVSKSILILKAKHNLRLRKLGTEIILFEIIYSVDEIEEAKKNCNPVNYREDRDPDGFDKQKRGSLYL